MSIYPRIKRLLFVFFAKIFSIHLRFYPCKSPSSERGSIRKEALHHVHLIPKTRDHSPENLGQSIHSLFEQWEGATGFRLKKRGKSEAFPAVFFFRKSLLTALCRKAERSQYDYDIT